MPKKVVEAEARARLEKAFLRCAETRRGCLHCSQGKCMLQFTGKIDDILQHRALFNSYNRTEQQLRLQHMTTGELDDDEAGFMCEVGAPGMPGLIRIDQRQSLS